MKVSPNSLDKPLRFLILFSLAWLFSVAPIGAYEPVPLVGANGQTIEFAGAKELNAEGITLLLKEGDDPIFVVWNSFDMEALKANKAIFAAYEKAKNSRTAVPLRLGFYEDMVSEKDFRKSLAEDLSKKDTYKIPKLSDFFEHKDDDQSYLSTGYHEDKNAAKRSKRFVDDYTELLTEFFKLENLQLNRDTVVWTWNNEDPFVIVKEATVKGPSSIELSPLEVMSFFANERNHSRPRCSKYLTIYPNGLAGAIKTLDQHFDSVESRLLVEESTRSRYKHLLSSVKEHFEKMQRMNSLDASVQRDFATFLSEFNSEITADRKRLN